MIRKSLIGLLCLAAALLDGDATAQPTPTAMTPGITRSIVTGVTDTASAQDYLGFVAWRSATAGAKTETLPVCAPTNNGMWIGFIDEQNTAAAGNISFTASSGTIAGAAPPVALITTNRGAIWLACNGASANWNLLAQPPASLLSANQTWTGFNSESTCTITAVANVFTPTCAVNLITITATGQTIAIPSGMPAAGATTNYQLRITYTGAFTPGFGTGTRWPGSATPALCNGTTITSGCFSATSGQTDWVIGQSVDATHIGYGYPLPNMGP